MKSYRFRKLKRSIGWKLKTSRLTRKLIIDYIIRKNKANEDKIKMLVEDSDKVMINSMNLRLGIVKDEDNLSFSLETYWPKFERFARNNNLQYSFYNIHKVGLCSFFASAATVCYRLKHVCHFLNVFGASRVFHLPF